MREFVKLHLAQSEEHRKAVDAGELPEDAELPLPSIPYVRNSVAISLPSIVSHVTFRDSGGAGKL